MNPLFYSFVLLNLIYLLRRHTYLNQSSSYKGPNKQTLATTSLMSVGNNLVANDGRRRMDAEKLVSVYTDLPQPNYDHLQHVSWCLCYMIEEISYSAGWIGWGLQNFSYGSHISGTDEYKD